MTPRSSRSVRDERGTILVITVVGMLLLAVLALSFSMVATLEGRMGVNYHGQVKALHVADAGIEGIKRELMDLLIDPVNSPFPLDAFGNRRWAGTWKPVLQALGTFCDGTKQVGFNFAPTDAAGWVRLGTSSTLFIRDNIGRPGEDAAECEDRDGIMTLHASGRLGTSGGLAAVNKPVSLDVTWGGGTGSGWDNAVNGGTGSGALINGNAMVFGGVRLVSTGGGVVWAMSGTSGVRNNYLPPQISEQLTSDTRNLLNPALLALGDVALNAGFTIQQGTVTFGGGGTAGLPQGSVTTRKETLDLAIANDFDPGAVPEIHADVERAGTVTGAFPFLADAVGNGDARTWEAMMRADGLHISPADLGTTVIDARATFGVENPPASNIQEFCRPLPCGTLSTTPVPSLFNIWINRNTDSAVLVVKGIIVFDAFPSGAGLQIGKPTTSDKLDRITYSGDAVIFVDDGSAADANNCITAGTACAGHLTLAASLQTANASYPTAVNPPTYPPAANTVNNIGIVAERVGLAMGADGSTVSGASQLRITGLFYAQTELFSGKQNEIFGSLFSRRVDLGSQVPKIAAVRTMSWFLPPGLIGSTPSGPGSLTVLRWREGTQ
jgi:hypothetical protein